MQLKEIYRQVGWFEILKFFLLLFFLKRLGCYCFINIYFDICKIERIKMQNKLNLKNYTASEIDSIYKETIINMDNITNKYLKEVDLGENEKFFRQWNKYVFDNLSIDNIKMVEESNK